MEQIPDAPWIRNCERWGCPDKRYLEYCDEDNDSEYTDYLDDEESDSYEVDDDY